MSFPSYSATVITGTLNSAPNTTYTLQFFANPTADPSGYGQGQTLIGTTTVTTDTSGNACFAATFTGVAVPAGDAISATATDPSRGYLGVRAGRHRRPWDGTHRGRQRHLLHRPRIRRSPSPRPASRPTTSR